MGLQRPGRSYVDQGEGLCRELAQASGIQPGTDRAAGAAVP